MKPAQGNHLHQGAKRSISPRAGRIVEDVLLEAERAGTRDPVGHHIDDVEGLKGGDDDGSGDHGDGRAQQRDLNLPEHVPFVGAVHPRRFQHFV